MQSNLKRGQTVAVRCNAAWWAARVVEEHETQPTVELKKLLTGKSRLTKGTQVLVDLRIPGEHIRPLCPDCGGLSEWGEEFGSGRQVAAVCQTCHTEHDRLAREHYEDKFAGDACDEL